MQERQIFWSGGIGDIFALESTFTDEQRWGTRRMYWATRAMTQVAPLFTRMPGYTRLVDHVSLWDEYPPGFCFIDLPSAASVTSKKNLLVGEIEDWSVIVRFPHVQPHTYSSFLRYRVANIARFDLPDDFIVVCPYSTVNTQEVQSWRRFRQQDWDWLLRHLHDRDTLGVVLNVGEDVVPKDARLIDLSNRTKIGEAVEVLKRASGYIGIDTCFSVLAAQMFPSDQIRVATMNKILWLCRHIYYAPQEQFDFIVPWLGATDEERNEWIQKSEATPQPKSSTGTTFATDMASSISGM